MKMIFASLTLNFLLASFSTFAGVRVTSVDLKTSGDNGFINISLAGRSNELPDIKVNGKVIEITLNQSDDFNSISKNVQGAELTAYSINGRAIIKAVLPYNVPSESVDLGWQNKNIQVVFPRNVGEAKTAAAAPVQKVVAPAAPAPKVVSNVMKDSLNEDYLNNLMKENTAKKEESKVMAAKDEINLKQAAPVVAKKESTSKVDNFSFGGIL